MAEKLALKKALFDELKNINEQIAYFKNQIGNEDLELEQYNKFEFGLLYLQQHKDFIQRLIDICVDRNKF